MLRLRSRTFSAVALACALAVAAAGCSSDSDSDGGSPKKTTTTTTEATSTTSTTEAPATTTTAAAATTTTTAPAEPGLTGPQDFVGAVDGQDAKIQVTFTRDDGIVDFSVSGLEIECQPLDNDEPSTRATKVTIPSAPIAADGTVDHTEEGSKYQPTLSGSFTPDGTFAGGLYLSGEDDGSVCGGEFTFIAKPT